MTAHYKAVVDDKVAFLWQQLEVAIGLAGLDDTGRSEIENHLRSAVQTALPEWAFDPEGWDQPETLAD